MSLVPATTPPQLDHTPGTPITITDDTIITPNFSLNYPDGWRVVKTSIAGAPLSFAFASPDDAIVITLTSEGCPDAQITATPPSVQTITREACLQLATSDIYLIGQTDNALQTQLDRAFAHIRDSLAPRN